MAYVPSHTLMRPSALRVSCETDTRHNHLNAVRKAHPTCGRRLPNGVVRLFAWNWNLTSPYAAGLRCPHGCRVVARKNRTPSGSVEVGGGVCPACCCSYWDCCYCWGCCCLCY